MDNSVIARSGWLIRKVSNKDWRKNWIELYRDGYLKYYENDYSPNPEDVINMPTECISVKTGLQVEESYCPPRGHSSQCVFAVSASGNKKWIFCADTPDDMRAWQLALEQARLLISRSPHGHHQPPLHSHHPHHQPHPHPLFDHSTILHNMRLAGLTGSTSPLEEYHRLNQYTQLQHLINSRSLPLTFNPADPRTNSTYPLHLPPPPPPSSLPVPQSLSSTSSSSSSSTSRSNNNVPVSSNNNSTVVSSSSISLITSTGIATHDSATTTTTSTSLFPIPVSPLFGGSSQAPIPPPPTQTALSSPPFSPNFNFNNNSNESPIRPGPLYPPMCQPTPLSPSRIFPSPFPEPGVRNFGIDVLTGSSPTGPDVRLGLNRLVWPPFIWW